jgi:hypothetical protein
VEEDKATKRFFFSHILQFAIVRSGIVDVLVIVI